jgi:uncharacterized repeat protein (TIGR01451 family)
LSVGKDGGAAPEPGPGCTDPQTCIVAPVTMVAGGSDLSISKIADRKEASVGDLVAYTVGVAYLGSGTARGVTVQERLPFGFRLVPGTLTVRRGSGPPSRLADPAGTGGLVMTIPLGDMPNNSRIELGYRVRIGIGAQRGNGTNSAQARSADGQSSSVAKAVVKVSGGVFTTDACILGKVFTDCDGNALQNGDEVGIPGARVYLEDGTNITTDRNGNFSLCGVRPVTHVMRVDPASLPAGATLLPSSNRNAGDASSLFVDLKNGELHRADFAVKACTPAQRHEIGERANKLDEAGRDPRRRPDFGLRFHSDRSPATAPRR